MRKVIIIPAVLVVGAALVWWFVIRGRGEETSYRFVEVTRGDVQSVVSSTGTLQATTTVEVGTQVSGKIAEIFVDFNDHVVKDQLLARIDPLPLEQAVRAAEADMERNEADLAQAQRELDRIQRLYERQVATESEHSTAQYQYDVAQASMKSSRVNLERARQNLSYTEIRAPIDGIVINRAVDAGQTVAASFSAPQLFLIAQDLAKMRILAAVDESDIGQIFKGQAVHFTVQAYPNETFTGQVEQVRLQSTMQENVVNYTAVVSVDNPDGRLLPAMTATVQFIVAQATGVLKVPNAALRLRPTDEMTAALRAQREARKAQRGQDAAPAADGAAAGGSAEGSGGASESRHGQGSPHGTSGEPGGAQASEQHGEGQPGTRRSGSGSGSRPMLWFLDENGKVTARPVKTGITDGQYTEVQGPDIAEGLQVIAALTGAATTTTTTNPFQNQQQPPGPPRLPGM
jgi:HlyD family secretion protein